MNPYLITKAAIARMQADTTLYSGGAWTAALAGGARAFLGPTSEAETTYPYCVVDAPCPNANHTFTSHGAEFTLRFDFYDNRPHGTDKLLALVNRMIGDSILQTDRVPTYGFHGHYLAIGVSATDNPLGFRCEGDLQYENTEPGVVDKDVYSCTVTFSGRVSAPAS